MEVTAELLNLVLFGRLKRDIEECFRQKYAFAAYERHLVPKEICVLPSTIPGAELGVFCTSRIKQGTEIGPYPGRILSTENSGTCNLSAHSWELVNKDGRIVAYIQGTSSPANSWLMHVQCARTESEQNMEVTQIGNNIYYRAIKDICRGDELLVWYSKTYSMYMGIPCTEITCMEASVTGYTHESASVVKPVEVAREPGLGGRWHCVLCQRSFNSRSNLRSHMRIHTLEKPFSCKFCGRKFSQSSTLRNHVRLHTGEKPYKCPGCRSSYSQLAGLRAHQRSSTHRPTGSNKGLARAPGLQDNSEHRPSGSSKNMTRAPDLGRNYGQPSRDIAVVKNK